MIKNILILLVFISVIFLLNQYYKQSSLKLNNHTVTLLSKNSVVDLVYKKKSLTVINFSNLHINQNKLTDNQSNLYYEEAKVEDLYIFNDNTEELIKTVFEAKEIKKVFALNELIGLQVIKKGGNVINLFVSDNDTQEIHMFYGLSNELFRSTIIKLSGKENSLLELKEVTPLTKFMSQWSVLHNNFDGVVSSIDY